MSRLLMFSLVLSILVKVCSVVLNGFIEVCLVSVW